MPKNKRRGRKRPNYRTYPEKRRGKKSSVEARRLIRFALRAGGSQRNAARLLALPTHAQLVKMLRGEIRDTPAMKAALRRADARSKRAWGMVKRDDSDPIDRDVVCAMLKTIEADLGQLKAMCVRKTVNQNEKRS